MLTSEYMPIDMWPARFIEELRAIPAFERVGVYDEEIMSAPAPPKQAFLPGLFLFGHARGYHLPTWDQFRDYYLRALQQHQRYRSKLSLYMTEDGKGKPGFLWRMSGWYEDSIAHAFLYSILVLTYEDLDQSAFVLYDARADWKFKADFIIVRCDQGTKAARISIYGQSDDSREELEQKRDEQEREMKANTSDSSHWRNQTYHNMHLLKISKTGNAIVERNFHLFSEEAIERLLTDIDHFLGQQRKKRMSVADMLEYRGR